MPSKDYGRISEKSVFAGTDRLFCRYKFSLAPEELFTEIVIALAICTTESPGIRR